MEITEIQNKDVSHVKVEEERHDTKTEKYKSYNYEEAIEMAGTGKYTVGLLLTLSLALLFMAVDMLSVSVVVAGCQCEFNLNQQQKSILVSMPFLGAIIMAYPWGYISDTQGRKKSLVIAMSGSFIASTIAAFSPNWIFLAVFKFISSSCCSNAQSATYALLGETCGIRHRGTYIIIMSSILLMGTGTIFILGYPVLMLNFKYDFGLMTFLPWRLLILTYALPLGLSAFLLMFYYESPKYLLNAGLEEEALVVLRKIYKRNGEKLKDYPVKKVFLSEEGNNKLKDVPLLKSLWEQLVPLFRPPLLWKSLQLYYIIAILYSSQNGFVVWFPLIVDTFFTAVNSEDPDGPHGVCNMIANSRNSTITADVVECKSTVQSQTALASIGLSVSFTILNLCLSKTGSRKKLMTILIILLSMSSGFGSTLVKNNFVSFIMYLCYMVTSLTVGFLFGYFVDLYPTSYRGMAACLGAMTARGAALIGINITGAFIMDHCATTIYCWCAALISAVIVALFLPSDKLKGK